MNSSPRRRAYSTNQIEDYNPLKKAYTSSDPSSVVGKNPLRRAKVQELIGQMSPDNGAQWKMNYQVSIMFGTQLPNMLFFYGLAIYSALHAFSLL